ncbi:MAG: hypothetical protein Q7S09_05810 [bacterium]|nr:hypothetical protein [bacterium]
MKKILLSVGILLAVAAVLWLLFSRFNDGGLSIASADGSATLYLPEGALPEDVSPADVSIAKEEVENFFVSGNGMPQKVTAYKLSPDGLELKKPATITLLSRSLQQAKGAFAVPLMFHKSKDAVEVVADTSVALKEDGTLALSGRISHFSWILDSGGQYPVFYASLEPYSVDVAVGETVRVKVTVSHLVKDNFGNNGSPVFNVAPGTTWRVNSDGKEHYLTEISNSFRPSRMDIPAGEFPQTQTEYVLEQDMTCAKQAHTTLIGRGGFLIEYTPQRTIPYFYQDPDGTRRDLVEVLPRARVNLSDVFQSYLYDCGRIPPVATVTPTPTPRRDVSSGSKIDVVEYQGKQLLEYSLTSMAAHPGCDESHWHANDIGAAKTIAGEAVPDTDVNGCGFGTMSSHPMIRVPDTRPR